MANIIEGDFTSSTGRYGIVVSRFNEFITAKLLEGALDSLRRHGVNSEKVDVVWCPGSFEIPVVTRRMAGSGRYDAVVCLGCVIRGATSHYDLVAGEVAKGVGQVALQADIPVIFGVISSDTIEQAIERAGTKAGNKGADAARAAIEMVSLMGKLS